MVPPFSSSLPLSEASRVSGPPPEAEYTQEVQEIEGVAIEWEDKGEIRGDIRERK